MKNTYTILGLMLLLSTHLMSGEVKATKQPLVGFLDTDSQTNLIVTRNGDVSLPCPPEYTNLLSNTNLFSLAEQALIQSAVARYKDHATFTTNSGPVGTRLVSLYKTNYVDLLKTKHEDLIGVFQSTNSVEQDAIDFSGLFEARHLDKNGAEYEVQISGSSEKEKPDFTFIQLKQGVPNGLWVVFSGDDHCLAWMHHANGLAVGKWLEWERDNGLSLEVEFKAPYDYFKNLIIPIIN